MDKRESAPHRMAQDSEKRPLELKDFKLFRQFSDEELSSIKQCVAEVCVKKGQKVFSTGDSGEEMFLVRRGGVRIMLPLQDGNYRHLATETQGGFLGELAFIDSDARSADVEAKWDTDLYVLSRRRFDERSRADARIGVLVFERLAKAIALRLRDTNLQIARAQRDHHPMSLGAG